MRHFGRFAQNKSNLCELSTKYNCDLWEFPLNSVECRISCEITCRGTHFENRGVMSSLLVGSTDFDTIYTDSLVQKPGKGFVDLASCVFTRSKLFTLPSNIMPVDM